MRRIKRVATAAAILAWAPGASPAPAQAPGPVPSARTPEALAALVVRRFAEGPAAAFDSVFPVESGRAQVADAARRNVARHPGLARVVSAEGDRAVLVLSGYVDAVHSGNETLLTRAFADFYEAERDARGGWAITRRLPLDAGNRILAHRLGVDIVPGEGVRVVDTLEVAVSGGNGFAARLNHQARLASVRVGGRPAEHAFAAGLLWVAVPDGERRRIEVAYALDVPHDPDSWSGYFLPASGFVRDQFLWHPVLNYTTPADHAEFSVTARAPADVYLSTSVEQTSRVEGGVRLATGRSGRPTPAVTVLYDREWRPYAVRAGEVRFEAFVAPGFLPARGELEAAFRRAHGSIRRRFGEPPGRYFAVAQRRESGSSGWHLLSNATMVAGANAGATSSPGPFPRAFLGHELAHGWTRPTGPGALFLMEGWATFAESYILGDEHGPAVERAFWDAQRNAYETGGYEGRASILADDGNGGIAYAKGAWILRMLRDALGEAAFLRGMRAYMAIPAGQPAGVDELARALSRASGRDAWPLLRPWLEERAIPDVRARVEDGRVLLHQEGPLFHLPLELEVTTPAGTVRRTVTLAERDLALDLRGEGGATAVRVDPDRRLLLRRRRGEVVRFTLEAPEADTVRLRGDFSPAPLTAVREGGTWVVEVPLSEGRYTAAWIVDGRRRPEPVVREVAPVVDLPESYPRDRPRT